MKRVLHNIGSLANGGMESFVLNLYRQIDTKKYQFDFVVGTDNDWCEDYAEEIRSRGGKVFLLKGGLLNQLVQFKNILRNYPEYQIVHSHRDANSALFLSMAKKEGIKVRIAHSHSSSESGFYKKIATWFLKPLLNNVATIRLACGKEAGEHLFKNYNYI